VKLKKRSNVLLPVCKAYRLYDKAIVVLYEEGIREKGGYLRKTHVLCQRSL